jgi:hypothetical protein
MRPARYRLRYEHNGESDGADGLRERIGYGGIGCGGSCGVRHARGINRSAALCALKPLIHRIRRASVCTELASNRCPSAISRTLVSSTATACRGSGQPLCRTISSIPTVPLCGLLAREARAQNQFRHAVTARGAGFIRPRVPPMGHQLMREDQISLSRRPHRHGRSSQPLCPVWATVSKSWVSREHEW